MKAAVALDDWKLPIFRERLTQAGFEYSDAGEMTPGTTILHVPYTAENFQKLATVIRKANFECARFKRDQQ